MDNNILPLDIKTMLRTGKIWISDNDKGETFLQFRTDFGYECTPIKITMDHPFAIELFKGNMFYNDKTKYEKEEDKRIEKTIKEYSEFG